MFDADGSGTLAFEDYADTTGTFTKEVIQEVRTFNSMKLLHIVLVADKKKDDLSSQALLTLRFKAQKAGTDRVIVLTQASSVVGPVSGTVYTISPQNIGQDIMHTTIVVSDAAPAATATPSIAPSTTPRVAPSLTAAPTSTPTPISGATPSIAPSSTPGVSITPTSSPTPIPTNTPTPTWTPTPTATPSPTPTPTPTGTIMLNLSVRFQGITQKPLASYCQDKKVKVTIKGSPLSQTKVFNDVVLTADTYGIFNGSLTLTDVPAGNNYTLGIKGPQHLQRSFTDVNLQLGKNTLNLSNTLLFVGDFPLQDGVLNQQDVQFLKSRVPVQQENQAADVNCDGTVNANDYSLLIESMQIKYDDEE